MGPGQAVEHGERQRGAVGPHARERAEPLHALVVGAAVEPRTDDGSQPRGLGIAGERLGQLGGSVQRGRRPQFVGEQLRDLRIGQEASTGGGFVRWAQSHFSLDPGPGDGDLARWRRTLVRAVRLPGRAGGRPPPSCRRCDRPARAPCWRWSSSTAVGRPAPRPAPQAHAARGAPAARQSRSRPGFSGRIHRRSAGTHARVPGLGCHPVARRGPERDPGRGPGPRIVPVDETATLGAQHALKEPWL